MTEVWEWRTLPPGDYENLECTEIHGVFALGQLWAVLALIKDDESEDSTAQWVHYTAPDPEDAWNGYESIDSYSTLEEGQAQIDTMRDEVLSYLRDPQ